MKPSRPPTAEELTCARIQHERVLATARGYVAYPELSVPWEELDERTRLVMANAITAIIIAVDHAGFDVVHGRLVRRSDA